MAHYKMSSLPAMIAGFTDRGILKEGFAADIMVYNLDDLGLQFDSPVYDTDFPGGERRIIQKAKGIRYTLVNGEVTFTEGTVCTESHAGQAAPQLRHGKPLTTALLGQSQGAPEGRSPPNRWARVGDNRGGERESIETRSPPDFSVGPDFFGATARGLCAAT